MKKIVIEGETFIIKAVTPFDYIQAGEDPPLFKHAISETNIKTMFDQCMAGNKAENNEKENREFLDKITSLLQKGVVEWEGVKFYATDYLKAENRVDIVLRLIDAVLTESFAIKSVIEISSDMALTYDSIARRYGKAPHEIFGMGNEFTIYDKFCFDVTIGIASINAENERHQRAMDEMKRGLK